MEVASTIINIDKIIISMKNHYNYLLIIYNYLLKMYKKNLLKN